MKFQDQKIESSNLQSLTYDSADQNLIVEFNGGGKYQYAKVPEAVVESFLKSDSKGKFFHACIKNKYETKKMEVKPQKYFERFPIDTLINTRRSFDIGDIFMNKAQCLICEEIVISTHRHDFVTCRCGNLSVDGGSWYLKRSFTKDENSYKELSEYYKEIPEKEK